MSSEIRKSVIHSYIIIISAKNLVAVLIKECDWETQIFSKQELFVQILKLKKYNNVDYKIKRSQFNDRHSELDSESPI